MISYYISKSQVVWQLIASILMCFLMAFLIYIDLNTFTNSYSISSVIGFVVPLIILLFFLHRLLLAVELWKIKHIPLIELDKETIGFKTEIFHMLKTYSWQQIDKMSYSERTFNGIIIKATISIKLINEPEITKLIDIQALEKPQKTYKTIVQYWENSQQR